MSIEELRKIVNKKIDKDFTQDLEFIFNTTKNLRLDKKSKILDIGTGYGIMATILALNGFDVLTGEPEIDPLREKYYKYQTAHYGNPHKAHHGNHHYKENYSWRQLAGDLNVKDRIKYIYLDAQQIDFPDKSFDAIFMYDALQHVNDKQIALGECNRILDNNGVLCIIETNQNGIAYFKQKYNFTIDLVDPRKIIKDKNIKTKVIEGIHTNFYILKRN